TMRLHEFFRRILCLVLPTARRVITQMRAVALHEQVFANRRPCHGAPFSTAVDSLRETFVCKADICPANFSMDRACNRSRVHVTLSSSLEFASGTQNDRRIECNVCPGRQLLRPGRASLQAGPASEKCERTCRTAGTRVRRRPLLH